MLPQNRHLVPWMLGQQGRHPAVPFKEGKIKEFQMLKTLCANSVHD
jgi:hypothetical protein